MFGYLFGYSFGYYDEIIACRMMLQDALQTGGDSRQHKADTNSMILYSAHLSPYSRKVRMTLLERDQQEKVEIRSVNPFDNDPDHLKTNPLAKVPALQLSSGELLCDSKLILDYLDSLAANTLPANAGLTGRSVTRSFWLRA